LGTISKHGTIDAPADKVFTYAANPRNAPKFISSIERILSGPEGTPEQGQVWTARANFLGRPTTVDLRLVTLRPPKLVRFAIEGEPAATLTLRLLPDGRATEVDLELEAPSVPGFLLNALMGGLLEEDMARLKREMEHS
jgi:uncharacterized membrane protein